MKPITKEKTSEVPSLLTRREASNYLRLAIPTMDRWRSEGVHLPYIKAGGKILYRRADLDAFLAKSTHDVATEEVA